MYRRRLRDGEPSTTGRLCPTCSVPIDDKRRDAGFCSKNCASKAWYYEHRSLADKAGRLCVGCGAAIGDGRHANATYCSLQCREVVRRVRAHGLSVTEYRVLLDRQNHRCAICRGGELTLREGLVRDGWHIDHDHESGAVRGVLCPHCNLLLGYAKDDPAVLRAAVKYLNQTRK